MCGWSPKALIIDISVAAIVQYAVGQRPLNIHLFITTPDAHHLFVVSTRTLYLDLDVPRPKKGQNSAQRSLHPISSLRNQDNTVSHRETLVTPGSKS
jgi:hypothetical protein